MRDAAAINATGNALDNLLTGNSGNNVLTGRAGNDTYGVTAGDTVAELDFNLGDGTDQIIGGAAPNTAARDVIQFGADIRFEVPAADGHMPPTKACSLSRRHSRQTLHA